MLLWPRQAPEKTLVGGLRDWFDTPLGQSVLNQELELTERMLRQYHGPNLLELSLLSNMRRFQADHIPKRLFLGTSSQQQQGQQVDAVCNFHELPVATESQDVVILHHLLEFSEHPHALLREVERIITPHGKIVIISFNPYSLLALRFIGQRFSKSGLKPSRLLSQLRLSDWLRLLGFEINAVNYGFHRVPLNRPSWFLRHDQPRGRWLRHFPLGGTMILSATKYRAPLTPAKIRWAPTRMANVHPLGVARIRSASKRGKYDKGRSQSSVIYRRCVSG